MVGSGQGSRDGRSQATPIRQPLSTRISLGPNEFLQVLCRIARGDADSDPTPLEGGQLLSPSFQRQSDAPIAQLAINENAVLAAIRNRLEGDFPRPPIFDEFQMNILPFAQS
jgi:hypothetical protein